MKATGVILAAVIAIAATSCVKNQFNENTFRENEELGLTIKGEKIITYDENTSQISYNESRNEFRITDDTMADFMILTCDEFPSEGKTITGSLTYTTSNDIKTKKNMSFKVSKTDRNTGKIWMWNQSGRIGAVVRIIY